MGFSSYRPIQTLLPQETVVRAEARPALQWQQGPAERWARLLPGPGTVPPRTLLDFDSAPPERKDTHQEVGDLPSSADCDHVVSSSVLRKSQLAFSPLFSRNSGNPAQYLR